MLFQEALIEAPLTAGLIGVAILGGYLLFTYRVEATLDLKIYQRFPGEIIRWRVEVGVKRLVPSAIAATVVDLPIW